MTVILGPDGLPITKQKEVPLDLLAVQNSDMETEGGRAGVVREVRRWHMGHAMNAAELYDLVERHDSRVSLEASDEHGDRKVLFQGGPTKLRIHKDEGKRLGYVDPTDFKTPEHQKDL
jgi:hypothetical protein